MFYLLTTQQGVVAEPRETERSQRLVKFLVRTAFRGEPLFRSLRPDFIETSTFSKKLLMLVAVIVPVSKAGLH